MHAEGYDLVAQALIALGDDLGLVSENCFWIETRDQTCLVCAFALKLAHLALESIDLLFELRLARHG